jgi:hypothetical protein
MKKTDWYPPHIKPVRRGIFETKDATGAIRWKYWSGYRWGWGYALISDTRRSSPLNSFASQNVQWRGLTEEAK